MSETLNKPPEQHAIAWNWGFDSWQTCNIQNWLKSYEAKIEAGVFDNDKGLTNSIITQINKAKEELANRLIKGNL